MKTISAKTKIFFLFLGLLVVLMPLFTFADSTSTSNCYTFETGVPFFAAKGECKSSSGLQDMIGSLIKKLFPIAGILAFAMIVYAGFEYATSGGDTNKQKDAQDRITNAIIGLLLLFAFWIIIYTINPNILKTQNISLPTIPTITVSNNANFPEALNPDQYLQEQKDTLNKLRAAANIFISARQITPDEYSKIIDPTTRSVIDQTNYIPVTLYIAALKQSSITDPNTDPHHGASCDYYVATVMRSSGLDPKYPSSNVVTQYGYITKSSNYQCISINCTKSDCCNAITYLTQDQAKNGSILFYDQDKNCSPDHTALWIDGNRLQASVDPAYYPVNRGSVFSGESFPVMAICNYKGF